MIKNKNILWVDVCKGLAILLMILGHSGMTDMGKLYIHSFNMPLFFILSGFLVKPKQIMRFKDFFVKKVRTIILPYFVFGFVNFVFCILYLRYYLHDYKLNSLLVPIKSLFCFNTEGGLLVANALWFLTTLFIVEIVFYFMLKYIKSKKKMLFALIAFSLISYAYSIFIKARLFWGIDIAISAIFFYGIGFLFKQAGDKVKHVVLKSNIFYIILGLGISFVTIFLNGQVDMRVIEYNNYFLFYFNATITSFVYIMIASYICKFKIMKYLVKVLADIGKNSMIYLVLNQMVLTVMVHISYLFSRHNIVGSILISSALTVIIIMPVSHILVKYLPEIVGKKRNHKIDIKAVSSAEQ